MKKFERSDRPGPISLRGRGKFSELKAAIEDTLIKKDAVKLALNGESIVKVRQRVINMFHYRDDIKTTTRVRDNVFYVWLEPRQ